MTVRLGTASGAKDLTGIYVGTASGKKTVTEGWIGTASGKKQFFSLAAPVPPLSASISPGGLAWNMITPGSYYLSDGPVTATPSGGVAPYYYQWESTATSATPFDQYAQSTSWESYDGTGVNVRCYVTDSAGQSFYTDYVAII